MATQLKSSQLIFLAILLEAFFDFIPTSVLPNDNQICIPTWTQRQDMAPDRSL
jgi:hypothetical protein